MSKAIAVFNMPEGCMRCRRMYISDYDGKCHCSITREIVEEYVEGMYGSKPKWCPLKEAPTWLLSIKPETDEYVRGWNDCLSKIIGDDDEQN